MSFWVDTSVNEVVFLRALAFPLSPDVESGRASGAEKGRASEPAERGGPDP